MGRFHHGVSGPGIMLEISLSELGYPGCFLKLYNGRLGVRQAKEGPQQHHILDVPWKLFGKTGQADSPPIHRFPGFRMISPLSALQLHRPPAEGGGPEGLEGGWSDALHIHRVWGAQDPAGLQPQTDAQAAARPDHPG